MSDDLIQEHRRTLRHLSCEAAVRHRVLMIRTTASGGAPEDPDVLQVLHRLGHAVFDLDLARHPASLVPPPDAGEPDGPEPEGPVPQLFSHEPVAAILERFAPDVVLVGGPGWGLAPATSAHLRERGVVTAALRDGSLPTHDVAFSRVPAFTRAELLRDPLPEAGRVAAVLRGGHGAGRDCDRPDHLAAVAALDDSAALPDSLAGDIVGHLASHHLLEHHVDAGLAALPGVTRVPDRPRPRTVMVSGYYGAGNRGDELLLGVLLDHFSAAVPGFQPIVAGSKPAEVERLHGVQSFARADLDAGEGHAERASALILGPGGHWHDYSIHLAGGAAGMVRAATVSPAHMAQLPLLVSAYGGSVHVTGMGVGPLQDAAARAAVHLTGRLARSVTVRDAPSAELLEPMSRNWPADVVVAPDVVYGLALPESGRTARPVGGAPARSPYLAVNLRPWTDDPAQRRALAGAILQTAAARGLGLVGVPMQHADVAALQDLAAAAPEGVDVEVLSPGLPLEEFLGVLRDAEVLVAMRLHASLLSHRLHRPALGLVYDPKVSSHFAELGRQDAALDLDAAPETVRRTLEMLLDEDGLPAATLAALDDLEARARRELHHLSDALAAEPLRVPDPAWIQYLAQAPARRAKPASAAAPGDAAQKPGTAEAGPGAAGPAAAEPGRESPGSPDAGAGQATTTARPRRSRLRRAAGRVYRGIRRRLS